MTLQPIIFTTIKLQEGVLKAPYAHIAKLRRDFFTLNHIPLPLTLYDLDKFLESQGHLAGTWRLNVFATTPPRFKLTPEDPASTNPYSLKTYSVPFYEPLAQYKKENFSLRRALLLDALKEGVDDWLFTNEEGYFLETAICNLFWVKNKILFTPSDHLPLYLGVTLQNVLSIADRLGLKVKKVTDNDIKSLLGASVFVSNSMKEILPVEKIDNQALFVNWELAHMLNAQTAHQKS